MLHSDSKEQHQHQVSEMADGASQESHQVVRSGGNITMPAELYERLYLQPRSTVAPSDYRKKFGVPAPLGLTGFVLGLTPLACALMGWRGAGSFGAATVGTYLFISGPLLFIGGILEFFTGNTFPFVVFTLYGGVFLALGATLVPFFGAASIYSTTGSFYEGMGTPGFYSTLAFFPTCVASIHLIFIVASTRINAVFFGIFVTAAVGFYTFAASLWKAAEGNAVAAANLQVGAGAVLFVCALLGWYLVVVQILASTGFPHEWLPVGDFSRFWEKRAAAAAAAEDGLEKAESVSAA